MFIKQKIVKGMYKINKNKILKYFVKYTFFIFI